MTQTRRPKDTRVPVLLQLDSSADLTGSVSRALTARFAAGWTALSPQHAVVRRDLHQNPLPHLPSNVLHWAPTLRTADETVPADAEDLQRVLIDEVLAADVLLVGAPMYNWTVPSTLKAWIDYLHVPGTTAGFDTGTLPLTGKPAVVISSRGSNYGPGTDNPSNDFVIPLLQQVLGTALGMTVYPVIAELTLARRIPALSGSIPAGDSSRAAAEAAIDELVGQLGAPA